MIKCISSFLEVHLPDPVTPLENMYGVSMWDIRSLKGVRPMEKSARVAFSTDELNRLLPKKCPGVVLLGSML